MPRDTLTLASTGISRPAAISCADLVKTYQNFIAEFPNHTKGATVRIYIYSGSALREARDPAGEKYALAMAAPLSKGGPNMPEFMATVLDTIKPRASKQMFAAFASTGYWMDSVMTAKQLFQWYMNEHLRQGYSHLHYADWLINSCGYKLNQLP
ncbi:hypothetical protein [Paraflavitalea speifideaquila]|uniref:hypothetical protein n=1 Tax=Paraflavitalea speifideaquila TaxID=3076558 RepID=UPI0028E60240|nr:hypothetical protein [Paraflavitalea speifideiaquila]